MRALVSLVPLLLLAHCGSSSSTSHPATDAGADGLSDGSADSDYPWPDSSADAGPDALPDVQNDVVYADSITDSAEDPDASPVIEGQDVSLSDGGVSARWAFEEAYDNVSNGDWYRDRNNETATLAWGESYVMMSLAAMFRTTGSPLYLERLAWHLDGVLANRDDRRGVSDYRGVSAACWQNKHYQPAEQPYCYVVHSGMIGYPMAEFVRLVRSAGLEEEVGWDGSTLGDKADVYLAAAKEVVAAHDDQWRDAGYYVFRPDASFLDHAGKDLPLNQSNAMGRMLLALHDVTGDPAYLDKATKLAQRFKAQITTGTGGEYLWNYWGGAYASPGEDISHAALNVDFAAMAAERGVVFTDADLLGFARTFMGPVYVDDRTLSNFVGGGSTNDSSYRAQCGRWLRLTRVRTGVYAAVRDLYEADYEPSSIGSGSLLYGWAALAEQEPVHRDHFFYSVDWSDDGDWRTATAYGANVLTTPPDLAKPSVVRLTVDVPRATDVEQWDGDAYHAVVRWQPTGGVAVRWVPYEPAWPFVYWNGGVLYQFSDSFVAGAGIRVMEGTGFEVPAISSTPPVTAETGKALTYAAQGTGEGPTWWALGRFPVGARVDSATGEMSWKPSKPGTYAFTVRLQNDFGYDEQSFSVVVP